MRLLENSHTQTDKKVLLENDQVKIEQTKLSEDLSTTTITIHAGGEYAFTARSGVVQTYVGEGTISNGSENLNLSIFNKIALVRGERIKITNNNNIPLIFNIISAN